MEVMLAICIVLLAALIVIGIMILSAQRRIENQKNSSDNSEKIISAIDGQREYIDDKNRENRVEINTVISNLFYNMSDTLSGSQSNLLQSSNARLEAVDKRLDSLSKSNEEKLDSIRNTVEKRLEYIQTDNNSRLSAIEQKLESFSAKNETHMNGIRETVEKRLDAIQSDNNQKLEKMREVVDEKLQKTLDE